MIEALEIQSDQLSRYDAIPSRFLVTSVLRATPGDSALGGIPLIDEPVFAPYIKDYDVLGD